MTQAGCSKAQLTHCAQSIPFPLLLRIHLAITATHPVLEAEKAARANPFQQSPATQLLFKPAQHSKSSEKPPVSRGWGWQELNVYPASLLRQGLV